MIVPRGRISSESVDFMAVMRGHGSSGSDPLFTALNYPLAWNIIIYPLLFSFNRIETVEQLQRTISDAMPVHRIGRRESLF